MLKAVAIGRLEEVVVARQTLVGGSRFSGRFWGKGTGFVVWSPLPEGGGKDEETQANSGPKKESKNPPNLPNYPFSRAKNVSGRECKQNCYDW